MTSLTPSNIPTEVLMVDLASIIRDPSWPVDPTLVASFRASIVRGEPPLLDLSLNRLRLADGSIGMEIIDGMHRFEALRQESVTEHTAKVREYTRQDAFYARIATSIGKPNELLRQRAERALREGFIRDLATHLEGAAFYQRGMTEDGTIIPLRRREPLPSDPLLALGTILWVHFTAKPEITEDWERYIIAWLDDIATRLGKTPEWLRDEILDITALLGEEVPGKRSAERVRLLLAIPDDGILRLVLARLKSESHLTTTDLRFGLDMLGCGPDVSRHTWLKSRGLQEMRGILGHATLSQLARDYGEALRKIERNKLLPRPERMQILPSVPSPQLDSPFDPPDPLPGGSIASVESRPADQSQVFGIVSPTFVRGPLEGSATAYGVLLVGSGVGALLCALAAGSLSRVPASGKTMLGSFLLQEILLALVPLGGSHGGIGAVAMLEFGSGFCNALGNTFFLTILQQGTPRRLLGRVMGALLFTNYAFYPVSVILGGVVVTRFGPAVLFPSAALLVLLAIVVGWSMPAIRQA